jgi:hypothetical protein
MQPPRTQGLQTGGAGKNIDPKWVLPTFPQLHKNRALTLKAREFSVSGVDG